MDALKIISEGCIKAERPEFNVGDTVRVDVRIKEGERERVQAFEGTVIAKKHGGVAETFTVRRVAYGVGIAVSPSTAPALRRSPVSARARSVAPSCSICVAAPARLPRSRAASDYLQVQKGKGTLVVPFFFIYFRAAEKGGRTGM